jgi:hypothetical protein
MDGRSLLPLLRDPGRSWGRDLLLQRGGAAAQVFQALRTPRYKYVEYGNGDRELYDLVADPHELQSRHGDPAYAAIKGELERRLAQLRRCAGATCLVGPRVAVAYRFVRGARGCARSGVRVSLAGADVRRITQVEFRVAGRRIGVDVSAPFARVVSPARLGRGGAAIRLRVWLTDGHVVTYDRRVRACG